MCWQLTHHFPSLYQSKQNKAKPNQTTPNSPFPVRSLPVFRYSVQHFFISHRNLLLVKQYQNQDNNIRRSKQTPIISGYKVTEELSFSILKAQEKKYCGGVKEKDCTGLKFTRKHLPKQHSSILHDILKLFYTKQVHCTYYSICIYIQRETDRQTYTIIYIFVYNRTGNVMTFTSKSLRDNIFLKEIILKHFFHQIIKIIHYFEAF